MRTRRSSSRVWFSTKTRRVSVGMAEAARRGIDHPGLKPAPVERRRCGGASADSSAGSPGRRRQASIATLLRSTDRSGHRKHLASGQGRSEILAHFRHIHCGTERNFRGKPGTIRNQAKSRSKVLNCLVISMRGNDLASRIPRFDHVGVETFKTGALNHSATCPHAARIAVPMPRQAKNHPGARVALPRRAYSVTSVRSRRRMSGVT